MSKKPRTFAPDTKLAIVKRVLSVAASSPLPQLRPRRLKALRENADSEGNRSPFRFQIALDSEMKSPTIPI